MTLATTTSWPPGSSPTPKAACSTRCRSYHFTLTPKTSSSARRFAAGKRTPSGPATMITSRSHRKFLVLALAALLPGLLRAAPAPAISSANILADTKVLSSDEFEGRAPGSAGEEKTVAFLVERFKQLGLQPGNQDGTFIQNVPLVGITSDPKLSFALDGQTLALENINDFVGPSSRLAPVVTAQDTGVVFVGYGVVAPEYGWDDYKGVDVKGKTVVMLVNDPAVPDPDDPSKLDPKLFKGRAMTYYGRWTYKYEIATEKGASAAILVHETGPAGYPYQVVVGSWGRENFDIPRDDDNRGRVAVEAWIRLETAQKLFAASGFDFAKLKASAARKDFRPVDLNARGRF